MREGFLEITRGWTLIDGMEDLTDRIERLAVWTKTNGPLQSDEEATVALLIKAQIARGMPDVIRMAGLDREYGLPSEDHRDESEDVGEFW